ncbi:hypothetical protein COLO4_01902, partial [Corchorus olitorius]
EGPKALMDSIVDVQRQAELGPQVVSTENIEVGIQCLRGILVAGQLQAHRRHFCGTEMVVALRAAQTVSGDLLGLQAQHRETVQVRTLAEHLACLGPGRIQQDEQRPLARLWKHLGDHARRLDELTREHDIGLPVGLFEQGEQLLVYHRTLPAEGAGIVDYVGNKPTGVGWLEWLGVMHQQAHRRRRRDPWAPCAQAIIEDNPAIRTTRSAGTTGDKGFDTEGQALGAQA